MAEQETPVRAGTKKRQRSPAHPGIDLETAIDRARALYSHERRNAAHVDTILNHWGYKPKSGAGLVVLAALKYYGLLVDEGSGDTRSASLSDRAFQILLDEDQHSSERLRAIRDAALAPKIHRELWERYQGTLPSDHNLRRHLLIERRFTESAADDFIPQFKNTVAFAKLQDADTVSTDAEDPEPEHRDMTTSITGVGETPRETGERVVQIPLTATASATLRLPSKLSDDEWDRMLAHLKLMKPAFVERPDDQRGETD